MCAVEGLVCIGTRYPDPGFPAEDPTVQAALGDRIDVETRALVEQADKLAAALTTMNEIDFSGYRIRYVRGNHEGYVLRFDRAVTLDAVGFTHAGARDPVLTGATLEHVGLDAPALHLEQAVLFHVTRLD